MGKAFSSNIKRLASLFVPMTFLAIFILTASCMTAGPSRDQGASQDVALATIKDIEVSPSQEMTMIKVMTDRPAPYTVFQLNAPYRVVLDIRGKKAPELTSIQKIDQYDIRQVRLEESPGTNQTTRLIIESINPLEYQAENVDNTIQIILRSKALQTQETAGAAIETKTTTPSEEPLKTPQPETTLVKPRIFFQPKPSDLNQILGIDFMMLDQGKSKLVITTDKKSLYELKQQGSKTLVLKINKTTLPDLLKRHIDSKHFEGVVDQIKASFLPNEKLVTVAILLRELVPFHVDQTDNAINIDFGATTIKPPDQKIVPLQVAEARNQIASPIESDVPVEKESGVVLTADSVKPADKKVETSVPDDANDEQTAPEPQQIPGLKRRYRGEPMTMDFVNADIGNILKLISEVSNLNIVWGPEVQGMVSMRLKNVPWDQALDLILANNKLAKRETGNVIWITTSEKMAQYEADERKRKEEIDAEAKRKFEARKKQEELEPLLTVYLPLDFAGTKDMLPHMEAIKTARGKVSQDERTNTIIVNDVQGVIQKARGLVKQFDVPVKQIMIEARIVDTTDDFVKSLGVQWTDHTAGYLINKWYDGQSITVPPAAQKIEGSKFGDVKNPISDGQSIGGGTFTTNTPGGWLSNLGFTIAAISRGGRQWATLDAKLALSETEGKTKTISAPKVIAREGTEAVIKRGDSIIQAEATANTIAWKEIEALLSLIVTPVKVSYNDFIILKIKVTDDRPTSFLEKIGVNKKLIETNLMVKTGDTVVIGGIFKEDTTTAESGIPGLRRIPLLGWLFKANYKKTNKSELLIFITPSVMPS